MTDAMVCLSVRRAIAIAKMPLMKKTFSLHITAGWASPAHDGLCCAMPLMAALLLL